MQPSYPNAIQQPLCKVPSFIQFQTHCDKQIHSFLIIQNLSDSLVNFKIKTNSPTEYIVKPMQGQIYNKEKIKIIFKRKKISDSIYLQIMAGFANCNLNSEKQFVSKEKFMIQFNTKKKNAIGIEKIDSETIMIPVKFIKPKTISENALGSPSKLPSTSLSHSNDKPSQKSSTSTINTSSKATIPKPRLSTEHIISILSTQKQKLSQLITQRQQQQSKLNELREKKQLYTSQAMKMIKGRKTGLNMENVICLILIALVLGLLG